jgi:hypothetical protein
MDAPVLFAMRSPAKAIVGEHRKELPVIDQSSAGDIAVTVAMLAVEVEDPAIKKRERPFQRNRLQAEDSEI